MCSDMELSMLDADESYTFDCHDEVSEAVAIGAPVRAEHKADAAAATRKVWQGYLARFGVMSAIVTVTMPGAGGSSHFLLIGLDHVRNEAGAADALILLNERLWRRVGQTPAKHFQLSTADLHGESIAASWRIRGENVPAAGDGGIAIQLKHEGADIRGLFFCKGGSEGFSEQDSYALQMIAPLLADSVAGAAQLARQSQRSAMLEAMFNRVSLSMALLSAEGQPLFVNSAAASVIDQRKWLIRAADGSIIAANPQQAKALRDSIRRAATSNSPVENVFRLDCRNGDWRLAYVFSVKSRPGAGAARCAMMIVMGPGKVEAPRSLFEALGLLPSEQRFLGHFLRSSSLGNAAVGCGLSEETARTYLKRVRAKLGVHRQMELAGLISGLALPLQASDSSMGQGVSPSGNDARRVSAA